VGAVTREKGGVNRIRNQERAVAELLARIIRQTDRDAAVIITPDGWDRRRLERYLIDVVIKHASIHWITISADGSDDVWPSALR
jgi:primase-polymerase (primpol)-like protein